MDVDTQELQFQTIFRNRYGVTPQELGLEVDGYEASGNGHTIKLHVENDLIIDWKLDNTHYAAHDILQKNSHQEHNLVQLKSDMGLSS